MTKAGCSTAEDQPPALAAAREWLELTARSAPQNALVAALDRLLVAYHDTACPQTSEHPQPPRGNWPALYQQLQAAYPDLGLYPVRDPVGELDSTTCEIGDAIDDLADISVEMGDVIWLAENVGADAALANFHSSYPHWSRHARSLALLLDARLHL